MAIVTCLHEEEVALGLLRGVCFDEPGYLVELLLKPGLGDVNGLQRNAFDLAAELFAGIGGLSKGLCALLLIATLVQLLVQLADIFWNLVVLIVVHVSNELHPKFMTSLHPSLWSRTGCDPQSLSILLRVVLPYRRQ